MIDLDAVEARAQDAALSARVRDDIRALAFEIRRMKDVLGKIEWMPYELDRTDLALVSARLDQAVGLATEGRRGAPTGWEAPYSRAIVSVDDLRALVEALRPSPEEAEEHRRRGDVVTLGDFGNPEDAAEYAVMARQLAWWELAKPLAACLPEDGGADRG